MAKSARSSEVERVVLGDKIKTVPCGEYGDAESGFKLCKILDRTCVADTASCEDDGTLRLVDLLDYLEAELVQGSRGGLERLISYELILFYHGCLNIQRDIDPDRSLPAVGRFIERTLHVVSDEVRLIYECGILCDGLYYRYDIELLHALLS